MELRVRHFYGDHWVVEILVKFWFIKGWVEVVEPIIFEDDESLSDCKAPLLRRGRIEAERAAKALMVPGAYEKHIAYHEAKWAEAKKNFRRQRLEKSKIVIFK